MRLASVMEKSNPTGNTREETSHLETKMPAQNYFLQNCPVCGRPLHISVEYRGRTLNCRHCGGNFTAIDSLSPVFAAQNSSNALLRRAEQLLDLSSRKLRLRPTG